MCSSEDIRDATKADLSSVPLEFVDVGDEDVTPVEHGKERPSNTKPSTTSSDTENDLFRDSAPGTS